MNDKEQFAGALGQMIKIESPLTTGTLCDSGMFLDRVQSCTWQSEAAVPSACPPVYLRPCTHAPR